MFEPLDGLTMPGAVPGAAPFGGTGGVSAPAAPPAPPGVSSPLGGPALLPAFGGNDSAGLKYAVETQSDGTILIRIENPDGSLGPVVQHLAAPKLKGAKPGGGV